MSFDPRDADLYRPHDFRGTLGLLLARGADIDDDIGYGYTMLIDACVFNSYRRAICLVDRGASVNVICYALQIDVKSSKICRIGDDLHLRPLDICCWKQELIPQNLFIWRQSLGRELSDTEHEHLERKAGSDRCRLVSKLVAAGAHMNACGAWRNRIPPLVAAAAEQ